MLARWTARSASPAVAPVQSAAAALVPRRSAVSAGGLLRAAPVTPAAPAPAGVPAEQPSVEVPADWEGLRAHVLACQACDLHTGRSTVVFGDGALASPDW